MSILVFHFLLYLFIRIMELQEIAMELLLGLEEIAIEKIGIGKVEGIFKVGNHLCGEKHMDYHPAF